MFKRAVILPLSKALKSGKWEKCDNISLDCPTTKGSASANTSNSLLYAVIFNETSSRFDSSASWL